MQVTIRETTFDDAERLVYLSRQLGYRVSVEEMQERIGKALVREEHGAFVAIVEEQVAGWIHGFHTFRLESGPFVEIGGLVVDEHHRRQGIGQLLIGKVKEWAAKYAVHKIRVRCNTTRTDSHAFYLRAGFTQSKEQKIFDLSF